MVLANVVLYLTWWATYPNVGWLGKLHGSPRTAPWSLLTFFFLEPHPYAGVVLGDMFWGLFVVIAVASVFWLGGDLEKSWGTPRFTLFLAGTSAASYLVVYTVTGHALTGLAPVLANLVLAWLTQNATYELRVMFMFTLSLGFFRWVTLGMVLLSTLFYTSLLPGLSALVGPLLSWWWAGQLRPRDERPRLQVLEGGLHLYEEMPGEPTWADAEIDRILDKIRDEGMDSLTAQERELLDSRSRQLRRE